LQAFLTTAGEGFQAPDGTTQVLFRRRTGELSRGNLTADGDVLAIKNWKGGEEIFGENLKVLRRGKQVLFSSNPATDVAIREPGAPAEIHVFCSATTDLRVYAGKPPREVRLDQELVRAPQGVGLISFAHLAKGEHVVKLSY
jgi:hypothetical protein